MIKNTMMIYQIKLIFSVIMKFILISLLINSNHLLILKQINFINELIVTSSYLSTYYFCAKKKEKLMSAEFADI